MKKKLIIGTGSIIVGLSSSLVFSAFLPELWDLGNRSRWFYAIYMVLFFSAIVWVLATRLIQKRLKVFSRPAKLLILGISLALGVGLSVLRPVDLSKIFPNPVLEITALGTRNPLSQGTEIWILGVMDEGGKEISKDTFILDTGWGIRDGVFLSYLNQPGTLKWHGAVRGSITVKLITSPWSGNIKVVWDNQEQLIDLYSSINQDKELKLVHKASLEHLDSTNQLFFASETIVLSFLILTILILLITWYQKAPVIKGGSSINFTPHIGSRWILQKLRENIKEFALLLLIIYLTYFTALTLPFGMPDDISHLVNYLQSGSSQFFLQGGPKEGRIVQGVLLSLVFQPSGLTSFQWYRVIQLMGNVLLAFMFYKIWNKYDNKIIAISLGLLLIALPSFQVWLAWAMLMFLPYAACLAGCSAWLLDKAIKIPGEYKWKKVALIFLSIFLLWVSLNIYQPAAMFFWVFSLLLILLQHREFKPIFIHSLWAGCTGATGIGAAYLTLKLAERLTEVSAQRTSFVSNIIERFTWFIQEPLTHMMSLHLLPPNRWAALLVAGLILVGLVVYLRGPILLRILSMGIIAGFVILAYLPSLIVMEAWASYRTVAPLAAILLILVFLAMKGLSEIPLLGQKISSLPVRKWLIVGLTGGALFLCAYNFNSYFSIPLLMEHRLLKYQLKQAKIEKATEIHIIGADWTDTFAPTAYYDEFGMPGSFPTWGVTPLTKLILWEINPAYLTKTIIKTKPENISSLKPDDILIDLRKLKDIKFENK